jgi:hypothetical protein
MKELAYAKSFRDPAVCNEARATANKILKISKTFPRGEMYLLIDF